MSTRSVGVDAVDAVDAVAALLASDHAPAPSGTAASDRAVAEVVAETVIRLIQASPRHADVEGVESGIRDVARVRGWLDSVESAFANRAEALAEEGFGGGARETLVLETGVGGRRAGAVAARARTVGLVPGLEPALASGAVSAEHVDAITRAAPLVVDDSLRESFLADPQIAAAAQRMRADSFATWIRRRALALNPEPDASELAAHQHAATKLRGFVRKDGMHVINGEFDPETGAAVFAAVDREVETLAQREGAPKTDHTRAMALASLVDRGLGAGPNNAPAEIIVIDAATLADGLHDDSVCETSSGVPLAPDTVRRRCCEGVILPTVIRGTDGTVLDQGREIRVANRAQRRALRAMYATCAFLGCEVSFDHCQIHHVVPWERGGPTDLENLLPLCSRHHHAVHEGRWRIRLEPDRTLVIHRPDGAHHATVPLPSRQLAGALIERDRSSPSRCGRARPGHNRAS